MLLAYPAMADKVTLTTGVAQAVPAAEASSVADTAEKRREALQKRVTAWWSALIRQDFETAYSLTSPGYRNVFSLEAFKGRFDRKSGWRGYEVVGIDFKSEDAAVVGINMHFLYHPPQTEKALDMKTYIQESWVLVDDQWWYLVKD